MKFKVVLGIILLFGLGFGSYIYKNRYLLFKYLPAIEEKQLENFNGKLCYKDGKLFSGRTKIASEDYLDIYSYKNGEFDGLNVIYYKNNIKEIGHWKDGRQNGIFQLYTEEGILIDSTTFKNGERDGITKQFYSDTGKLRVLGNYKNGVLDGKFKAYYENGNLKVETDYKNGELSGEFKEYYENGNLKLRLVIKNFQLIEKQRFNPDGTIDNKLEEKIFKNDINCNNCDEVIISESEED